ncbi:MULTISPECIES: alpha/beta hydrolase [unclassified Flavobacterium]|uniref:alpha/beta hydrolase n=1 Tax=unclassified Flavobacterium TaxID=196869 RepID=UPI001F128EC4|nr:MULTISPECIES: alpha/beta hydrolase-fold protein [unclassified Flavobacterium]UMY66551.1 esterase family protein [Flavobacterium sp. HJ-32-4]
MKKSLILLLAFFCVGSYAQRSRDTLFSEKLNADRTFTVSLPLSYGKDKNRKYPLLLLFDGEYLLDAFDGAFAYGNYWDDLPEVIIVGVDMKGEREADTTLDQEGLPTETGAHFFEFIGAELIPALEKKYRIAPFRIVAGHDLTAGFMNLWLYKEDPLFSAYISLSPEFGEQMRERIPTMLMTLKKPVYYFLSAADGDLPNDLQNIQIVDTNIKTVKNDNLHYRYEEYLGATHYSMVLHAIPDALYHIFGPYQPISTKEFQEKIVTMPGGYVEYLTKKYETVRKSYGMDMPIRIGDFKAIEAAILKNKTYDDFEKLAALSKKAYPKSMLSQYHMGMYYEKKGDTKKAAKAYQNAYLLDEIGDLTKDMMLEKAEAMKNGEIK